MVTYTEALNKVHVNDILKLLGTVSETTWWCYKVSPSLAQIAIQIDCT